MRIHHTDIEVYRIYFRCGRSVFHFHHLYSSVAGYRAEVKRLKSEYLNKVSEDMREDIPLEIQVIWAPYPSCDDSDTRVILQEAFIG